MDASPNAEPDSIPPSVNLPSRKRQIATYVVYGLICYLLVAYLILPRIWETYAHRHPSFDDNPRLTETADGHPGDALNVALTGTEAELLAAMQTAKWYRADPLGIKSDLKIAVDTVVERPYDQAPVSSLFLYGRPEDFAFEQPVGHDPRKRHHVRFWRSTQIDENRPVWIGSATYDTRVGFSHTTGQITHHTDPNIDAERSHVLFTLKQANQLSETYIIKGFHTKLEGKNGGGDPWHTDGDLWVGVIKQTP
ncbi:MAG: LssY C-terminal domain-containing protein [Planctomycetaceae bacterium]|nr:LssY C-terminal domain-containing protein [Planctomycetaceae bacterium]